MRTDNLLNIPAVVAASCGTFAIVTGASAILGWLLDMPRLTDWTNQGISMFVNAGLCAILCGVALVVRVTARLDWGLVAVRVIAAAVTLLAGLVLAQHVTGADLGVDMLLVGPRDWGQAAAASPMRMGVPASTSYLILSTALVLTTLGRRERLIATLLALLPAAVVSLSLTGYWFGADQLFGIARFTGIALQTSVAIAALSVGVMAAVPEFGLVAALRRDDAGGQLHRRLLAPVLIVPLVLGWLRIVGQQQGLYDMEFGTALRSLTEVALFFVLLWWTANNISLHAKSAQKAQSRLAAIIESSDDAIISKSLEGVIESWNTGAQRVFGYTAEEARGKHISMLIPTDRLNEETEILTRLKRGERIEHFETVRVRKDGTLIQISLTISPIKDAMGRIIGASKIARDITPRKQLEQEREHLLESERAARSEAEHASHLKDEFLATLSHELRTPLNAILGWSQLLSLGSNAEDLEQGLDAIQRNARAQAQLIEDLLDMSRIISGKVRLDVQPVDLTGVIQAAIESISPAAEAKGILVRRVLDPNAEAVSGDPTRLQQVVWNLLTNAIKFTPKGGKVDVVLERVDSQLEIIVRDTGIGLSPEFLPVIFERFRQVDSSTTRAHGGLGLGLSIVKHLVELHGGTIRATSQGDGQGATFIVTLPLSPVRSQEGREPRSAARSPAFDTSQLDLGGVKVLVVDDEPDARALVERVLTQCGADVRAAGSAAQGLEQLRSFRPHVVVSDIGMPVTDGYQFMRDVRNLAEAEGGRTPAIALTAFARSEDRMRAMLAGYQVHVAKPIEPQELAVTVRTLYRNAV